MSFRFTNDKRDKLDELSSITIGSFTIDDANKVLAVAADGTNIVLADIPAPPSELPSAGASEDGYVVKWQWTPDSSDPTTGSGVWVVGPDATGGGGATTLSALTDTDITSLNDGSLLAWIGGMWSPVDGIQLSHLPGALEAEDGHVLKWSWDAVAGEGSWVVAPDASGGGTLEALTDTDSAGAVDGDLLMYNAGSWAAESKLSLFHLPDLFPSESGSILKWHYEPTDPTNPDAGGVGAWIHTLFTLDLLPDQTEGQDGQVLKWVWNPGTASGSWMLAPADTGGLESLPDQGAAMEGWSVKWTYDDDSATGQWVVADVTEDIVEATELTVTVISDPDNPVQNVFAIDGVPTDTITLLPGLVYKFDQSNVSNETHPLRFSITPDGTWGGGSDWLSGVTANGTPGQYGAYTTLKVSATTPATLYYYCGNHAAMGGQADLFSGGGGSSDIDPRYVCDPTTGIQEIDFAMGATDIDMATAVWVKVKGITSGGAGSTQTLIIPNIDDADNPAGRRLIISDMNDLPEEDAVQVTIASGGGATAGQIDGAAFEEIFDYASLSIVCTGQRVGDDPTAGLIWKII